MPEHLAVLLACIDSYRKFDDVEFDKFDTWISVLLTLAVQMGFDPINAGQLLVYAKTWDRKQTFWEHLKKERVV